MSYCSAIENMSGDRRLLHQSYHDNRYGFPIHNDNELYGRLLMEINQAGLSWETILKKEPAFRQAYHQFDIYTVANYGEPDINRLLADPGIIRNRLKIQAAIQNAQVILQLQHTDGSFENWLTRHHPAHKADWVKLFRKTFRFTGGEIVGEFLMSIGYLPGAHTPQCPVYARVVASQPMWLQVQ